MPPINLEFKLREKQRRFVEAQQPWCAFIGGVGGGKTYSGGVKSLLSFVQQPESLGIIAAPNYTMLRDTTQRMFFDLLPKELIRSFNKNEQHLIGVNGSEVFFRSMDDPNKIRGINSSWAWLDEGPYAGYYAWQMLKQRSGRQNPKKFKKQAWITGTPKGRDGFWQEFVLNATQDHFFIQSSTYENLVNLPDNYVESMGLTGSFFQQEIMGSFEAFEGLVYSFNSNQEDPAGHVQEVPNNKVFKRVVGAVDWGYTNPAVALVFGVDSDLRVWLIAEYYQRQVRLEDFLGEILDMTAKYGVSQWWCDPAEPEHIDALKEKMDISMLPCEINAAANAIVPGIQTVQKFLSVRGDGKPGLIVHCECVSTIAEFLSYQYDKQLNASDDAFVKEKPKSNQADHAMDCARYMLFNEFGKSNVTAIAVSNSKSIARSNLYDPIVASLPKPKIVDEDGLPIEDIWWSVDDLCYERTQRMSKIMHFLEGLMR